MTSSHQQPNSQQKSFLASLFDFGFTSFVTLRFLKVIYAITVVVILIVAAFALIGALQTGEGLVIVTALFLVPIFALIYLIFARISFEIIAMFFRIGDNTFLTVQLLGGGKPAQWVPGAQPGYGRPPEAGPAVPNAPWNSGANDPSGSPTSATTVTQYGTPPSGYPQPQNPQGQYPPPQAQYAPPPQSSSAQHPPASQAPTAQYRKPTEDQYSKPSEDAQGQHVQQSDTPPPPQPGQERWGQSPNQ